LKKEEAAIKKGGSGRLKKRKQPIERRKQSSMNVGRIRPQAIDRKIAIDNKKKKGTAVDRLLDRPTCKKRKDLKKNSDDEVASAHHCIVYDWYLVLVIHSVLDVVGYSLVLLDLSRKTRLYKTGQ